MSDAEKTPQPPKTPQPEEQELSDNALESVAGGCQWGTSNPHDPVITKPNGPLDVPPWISEVG